MKRTWNLSPVFQIVQKLYENYCPFLYLSIGQVWLLNELWFKRYIQKCTHLDVTDLVNHGMVENTKSWISWGRYITFLRNKKMINLYLRWHILRNYRFVAKVTFEYDVIEYGVTAKNSFIEPGESCRHWLKIILWKELGHLVQKYCQTHFRILFQIWE